MQISRRRRHRLLRAAQVARTLGETSVALVNDRRAARDFLTYIYLWKPLRTPVRDAALPDLLPQARHATVELRNCFGTLGNPSVQEVYTICALIRALEPRAIFEFGTFTGLTTLQMAINACDEATVYTLNLPPEADITVHELGDRDQTVMTHMAGTGQFFANEPERDRIVALFGDSASFDFTPYERQIDLVFIDAGHDYENVRCDTENALRLLRGGRGTIVWHDFPNAPGVAEYLKDFAALRPVHRIVGTNMAVALVDLAPTSA